LLISVRNAKNGLEDIGIEKNFMIKNKDGNCRKTFLVEGITDTDNPKRITVRGKAKRKSKKKL